VTNFRLRLLYYLKKRRHYPLNMSLFGPQWRLAICKQEKHIGLRGHESQIHKYLAPNVVIIPSELCQHIAHIESRTRVSVCSVFNTSPLPLSDFCTTVYHHYTLCLTSPRPHPNPILHRVSSSASCLNLQSSSSCVCLLRYLLAFVSLACTYLSNNTSVT